jgi:hypothetical protein
LLFVEVRRFSGSTTPFTIPPLVVVGKRKGTPPQSKLPKGGFMGQKTARVNGQIYQFDEAVAPTMQELRAQSGIGETELFLRDFGGGRVQALSDRTLLTPDSFIVTIPRIDWGC